MRTSVIAFLTALSLLPVAHGQDLPRGLPSALFQLLATPDDQLNLIYIPGEGAVRETVERGTGFVHHRYQRQGTAGGVTILVEVHGCSATMSMTVYGEGASTVVTSFEVAEAGRLVAPDGDGLRLFMGIYGQGHSRRGTDDPQPEDAAPPRDLRASPGSAEHAAMEILRTATTVCGLQPADYAQRRQACSDSLEVDATIRGCTSIIANPAETAEVRGQAQNNRGVFMRDINRGLAAVDFEQAMRLDPNNLLAFINRGTERGQTDLHAGLRDFAEAWRRSPRNLLVLRERGDLLANKGHIHFAMVDANAAVQIAPNDTGLASWRDGMVRLADAPANQRNLGITEPQLVARMAATVRQLNLRAALTPTQPCAPPVCTFRLSSSTDIAIEARFARPGSPVLNRIVLRWNDASAAGSARDVLDLLILALAPSAPDAEVRPAVDRVVPNAAPGDYFFDAMAGPFYLAGSPNQVRIEPRANSGRP